ncbi:MAG: InlB B-repeat-containing protein, partial [Clostridia bacterium]|nr:InlB B-repeat-containing protein [Clostridia bacterium]
MRKNKIMAWVLMLMMLVSVLPPVEIFAADVPTLTVATVTAVSSAATVDVPVSITHNPGILGATLTLTYDTELTLISAAAGDAFSPLTMTKPGQLVSGCTFVWDGQEIQAEDIKDGVILTLTFMLPETAESGAEYAVSMAYADGDIVDGNINPVSVTIVNGGVEVIDYMYGDLNSDQKVNTSDVILLRRSIAGGYSQTINENAADVNLDAKKNATDVILMRRFIAGGYGITFPYVPGTCQHTMQAIPYKAPTTTAEGNIAYWQCLSCKKYFSDASGTTEITWEDTVLPPLNVNEYAIVYNNIYTTVDGADDYLAAQSIVNPNPEKYNTEEGLLLEPLSVPGYTFNGWTDKNGVIWDEIPSGTTGRVILYANWKINTYKIQYACDMDPQADDTYTVNTGKQLPKPTKDTYTFLGWSDANGKMWGFEIPIGTTGHMMMYANWASQRNRAIPVKQLGDPIICEDSEEGLILFTYELGTIEKVPLFVTQQLHVVNGMVVTLKKETQNSISNENAIAVSKAISNSTTDSSTWTLENSWSDTTEVSETSLQQLEITREEAEERAKNQSNSYNMTNSMGGSQTLVDSNSSKYRLS